MDELEVTRKRIAEIERQAEARRIITAEAVERQTQLLKAERDAARVAETTEREKALAAVTAAQEAQGRATEALLRAERAETAIRQAKTIPGIRGRLVRLLAGDVLPD
jgi:multidrug efflux pump subunit AcrA (membrane-fusion protein)